MDDLSTLSTEDLMKMRAGASAAPSQSSDLSQLSTEDLMKMKASGQKPGLLHELSRQAGLTVRAGVQGITALPNMFGDALGLHSSQAVSDLMTKVGIPNPETPTERVSQDVAGGIAGAGSMTAGAANVATRAGSNVVRQIAERLSAGPTMQVFSGGIGSGAPAAVREAGGGEGAQAAAGLVAPLAAAGGVSGAAAAIRGAARGVTPDSMLGRMATLRTAGIDNPSVGLATGRRGVQAVESGLSKTPGSAGIMANAGEDISTDMGTKVNALADQLMPNATATRAGAKIEQGVKDFVQRFRGEQNFLYDKLDQHIPAQSKIDVSRTQEALAQLNADIPGAPNLSQWFKNKKIQGIESALTKDTTGQNAGIMDVPRKGYTPAHTLELPPQPTNELPYEAAKKLRTLVGQEIDNNNLASDVPRSKWKALYGALSEDLGTAAQKAGPDAEKAFNRANTYSRAGYDRIEIYLDRVAGKDTVEKVFQAAVNPSEIREGGSTVNAVMRSLDKDQRKAVQAAFLKRMGQATAGNQDDTGGNFSATTFLTNWNKVSPEARLTLFADGNGELAKNLGKVAAAANMVKDGSKVFSNPSGTSQSVANMGTMAALATAVGTGHMLTAATILGGIATANASAKLMTNPNFVRWLAKTTEVSPALIPAQLNSLIQSANKEQPDVRSEILDYARRVAQASEAQTSQTRVQ